MLLLQLCWDYATSLALRAQRKRGGLITRHAQVSGVRWEPKFTSQVRLELTRRFCVVERQVRPSAGFHSRKPCSRVLRSSLPDAVGPSVPFRLAVWCRVSPAIRSHLIVWGKDNVVTVPVCVPLHALTSASDIILDESFNGLPFPVHGVAPPWQSPWAPLHEG